MRAVGTVGTRLGVRGDLVRIDDDAEAAFIAAQLTRDSWLGATDSALEGLWRWADNGVPFWRGTAHGSAQLAGFERWADDQPDGASADEDCAQLRSDGSWSDQDCGNVVAFVCETAADRCTAHEDQRDPGQCRRGMSDLDADGDGFAACNDACPDDRDKLAPGLCGCGIADSDRLRGGERSADGAAAAGRALPAR